LQYIGALLYPFPEPHSYRIHDELKRWTNFGIHVRRGST